jgi:AcrR family transcriptional regulator
VARSGRPRDPGVDRAVLDATRSLLAEVGFQGLTITAVAARAGVSAPSVYLRWPDKVALVEDAVFPVDTAGTPRPTGDLRADLEAWVRLFVTTASAPAARAAIPGLLSAHHRDPARARRLVERGELPTRAALATVLDAAAARGEPCGDADVETVFDLLRGATMVRALTVGDGDLDAFAARLADALARLCRRDAVAGVRSPAS